MLLLPPPFAPLVPQPLPLVHLLPPDPMSLVQQMLGESAHRPMVLVDTQELMRELTCSVEFSPEVLDTDPAGNPEYREPPTVKVFLIAYIDGEAPPTVSPSFDDTFDVTEPGWEERLRKEVTYFLTKELMGPYRIYNEAAVQKVIDLAKAAIVK